MPSIGVILTSYKRQCVLVNQVMALAKQTIVPDRVLLWNNSSHLKPITCKGFRMDLEVINCAQNMGVWPRFSMIAGFDTDYVCVFDDDTIPGPEWFENCLDSFEKAPGLYGASGVVFNNGERANRTYVGWGNPIDEIVEVDIVGHAWFLKTEWWRALNGKRHGTKRCGEDYYMSVCLQSHGIPTYVPPHSEDNKDRWGSTQGELGADDVALYKQEGAEEEKLAAHIAYLKDGWLPLALRQKPSESTSLRVNVRR